jgi:hypothetical protein
MISVISMSIILGNKELIGGFFGIMSLPVGIFGKPKENIRKKSQGFGNY